MRLSAVKDLTRIEQTLFGLPFMLSGFLLGSECVADGKMLPLVILAFVLARVSGMAFNQLIDSAIDARNPRTQNRVIPTGRATRAQAGGIAWVSLGCFVLICLQMNRLTAVLGFVAAALLYFYSYMKRLHASCHLVLACIHFLAPVMAFTVLTGNVAPGALFLGASAAFLIMGSDIVYAIQDYAFDCKEGLFSIPSRFGIKNSLSIALLAHLGCLTLLLCVGVSSDMPWIYYVNLPLCGAALFYFHSQIRKQQTIESQFFFCNVAVSAFTLLFIILGRLWVVLS